MDNKLTHNQIAFKLQQIDAIRGAVDYIIKERDYDDLSEDDKKHSGDLYNVAAIMGYGLKDSLDVIEDEEVKDEVMHLIKRYEKWVMPTPKPHYDNLEEINPENKLTHFQVNFMLQQMGIMIMAARYIVNKRSLDDLSADEKLVAGNLYDNVAIIAYALKDSFDLIEDMYKPDVSDFIKRYERDILSSLQPDENV
jgi:hypothetical protein